MEYKETTIPHVPKTALKHKKIYEEIKSGAVTSDERTDQLSFPILTENMIDSKFGPHNPTERSLSFGNESFLRRVDDNTIMRASMGVPSWLEGVKPQSSSSRWMRAT